MGVHQLWKVVEPTARPVLLESLRGKTLAIDASIWIYHFLKAMRNSSGEAMRGGHIIGFFRRICKLLFYEIRPVFIFDGAAPAIKKITTDRRKHRAHKRREGAKATANRLLTLQLQMHAKKQQQKGQESSSTEKKLVRGSIPKDVNYHDHTLPSGSEPSKFVPQDQYDLPHLEKIQAVRLNDQRLLTEEELDEYAKQFTSQARHTGFIDTNTVDFKSLEFKNLPIESQYQLLNEARLKSRLRMGYTSSQLGQMFPNSMEFSKFQIDRVAQRNFFTQRLMNLVGFEDDLTTRRINSEKGKEYMLKKENGGYIMSLGSNGTPGQPQAASDSVDASEPIQSESEDEFEDVDLDPQEKKETSSAPKENQDNIPDLNELFGWESQVQREQLYSSKRPREESTDGSSKKRVYEPDFVSDSEDKTGEAAPPWFHSKFKEETISSIDLPEKPSQDQQMGLNKPPLSKPLDLGGLFSSGSMFTKPKEVHISPQLPPEERPEPTPMVNMSVNKELEPKSPAATNTTQSVVEKESVEQDMEKDHETYVSVQNTENTDSPLISLSDQHEGMTKSKSEVGENDTTPRQLVEITSPGTRDDPVDIGSEPSPTPSQDSVPSATDTVSLIEPENEHDAPTPEPFILQQLHHESGEPEDPLSPEPIELEGTEKELADQEADYDEQQDEDIQNVMVEELEENNRFVQVLSNGARLANNMAEIDRLKQVYRQEKRDADNITEDMIRECMELLQIFGIPYLTAPGEAEAQCAELFDLKLVDGVVTDDGDCFLFGNVKVYRHLFNQAKYVEVYDSKVIEKELGLDRAKLIELAFLLGSDYTDGIAGVGPVTGVELLADFGSLDKFRDWWNHAQRYPDDANVTTSFRKRFLKKFSEKIFLSENFPDKLVSDSYWHPNVDPDDSKFEWGSADAAAIRKFMQMITGWEEAATNKLLLPVIEEQKRRDMLMKQKGDQSTLDEFAQINKKFRSKRAAAATERLSNQ